MASNEQHAFQLHHCIEQNKAFNQSRLLQALDEMGVYSKHNDRNLVYLPRTPELAAKLDITPHSGGPLDSYSDVVKDRLRLLTVTKDGQAAIDGDPDAARRVVQKVHKLEDTLKAAILNGDLYTNVPDGWSLGQTDAVNRKLGAGLTDYAKEHAEQIDRLGKLPASEAHWSAALRSERYLVATVEAVNEPGLKPTRGKPFAGHASLREAINQAHVEGRLSVSEPALAQLKEGFSAHVAEADAREVAAASRAAARGAALRSLVVGGVAVSLADAADASERISSSLDQDNPLAAKSHAVHFAGRGAGGAIGGAAAGLIAGSWTGPGVLLTVAAGAYTGSEAGEKLAKMWDNRQVYHQVRDNVSWEFTGRQWVRERTADISRDDRSNAEITTFAAPPEKARELYLDALNAATALELKNVPPPRTPFVQPQAPGDTPSLDPASWERNSRTEQWERNVVVGRLDHAANATRREIASPERAAELDRAADQVIRENIASGQAPIAARYEIAYRASGFDLVGEKLPAATNVLTEGNLKASNGDLYRRDESGQWLSLDGTPAAGNLPLELERTNAAVQPQLAQHREYVASLAPLQPPSTEVGDRDRAILLDTYLQRGVEPTQQHMDAAMLAIARTREANDIAPGMTTYQLQPNAKKGYDVTSSIAHVYNYSDGVPRIAAVTTAAEIDQARVEVQGRAAPIPDTPELRIEALSQQQRDAQEQALREANRMGLSRDDVQFAAQHAAAAAIAADREPEIVIMRDDVRVRAPTPEPRREPETPSPEVSKPPPPVAAPEPPPEQREAQAPTEDARKPIEPAHAAVSEAQPPLAPPTPPAATQPAPSTPAAPVASDDALQRGSEGQDVALLQYRLDRMGYRGPEETPLPQHGRFDAATEHGVRQFQEANRLPATGMVDPDTVQALAVAQQSRVIRPAPTEQREDPAASVRERQPAAQIQDAALASVAPPSPQPLHDDRSEAQEALARRPHQPLDARRYASYPAPEHAPTHLAPERVLASDARPAEPVSTSRQPEGAGAPAPPRFDHEPEPDKRAAPSEHVPVASSHAAPSAAVQGAETEPAFDLSRFSRDDQRMMDKIRAGSPAGLSDEHVAAAMLGAKRNGIPDADRLGPVVVVGDTLWVEKTVPGFHTPLSLTQQPPQLQETYRETQAVNQQYDQKQQQEAQERELAQQNQKQTDAMRPQL
ncbi:peptidoglycan-binding protein [Lysobacter sp. CA199]|uniref:peptidoglycan-binding protein n=1 Tax=Lysobacter sp. CA199 TaxID=3455608 RepID=UPI003F8D7590